MCGFVGIFNRNAKPVLSESLARMRDMLIHRGPDDSGMFIDGNLGFGFRRLSIIDIESGHQPMSTVDGRFTIVYNGEIFNYIELRTKLEKQGVVFRTHSDTEVLLQSYIMYGRDCLDYLNGMFAFAIWDRDGKELFFARDRIGVKPFYYYYDHEKLVFASEIKAIIADRSIERKPNYPAIADYLQFGYISDDKTFFENIHELLPGCFGIISESKPLTLQSYWDIQPESNVDKTEERYIHELRELLSDAVKIHLRSDVPVGCHLSGGLDSSTVACLSRQHLNQPFHTFSGKFDENAFYDETKYAKVVSLTVQSHYEEITPTMKDFVNDFHRLVWHMDQPAVGPGIVPQYNVCKLAARHVKVALGGQGGDELFGGYPRYILAYDAAARFTSMSSGMSKSQSTNSTPNRLFKLVFLINYLKQHGILNTSRKLIQWFNRKRKNSIKGFEDAWVQFSTVNDISHPVFSSSLRNKWGGYSPSETFLQYVRKYNSNDLISNMLYHDTKTYLRGLLQVEDRTSMSVSLESRVPLLDYRIVELAAQIPSMIKMKGMEPKYIFKQAIEPIIPAEILNRRDKKGFPTPIQIWLKKNPGMARRILLDASALSRNLFDRKQITKLLSSKEDKSWLIWSLLNVEMWFKIFIDEDPRYVDKDGKPANEVAYE